MFDWLKKNKIGRVSTVPATLDQAMLKGKQLSAQNRDQVILVVEEPGTYNHKTGELVNRQFKVYQHRGSSDFNGIPTLKGAWMNKKRVDIYNDSRMMRF